ncbi:MAG: lactonase family protein [Clostridiales bacterium]|nr:lactonase family protein [Clostridiales bacterium]
MSEKMYAVVGNWGFAEAPKGITTYRYDPESGNMELIETIRSEMAAGQLWIDSEKRMVYACDERGERRGEIGGGGYIASFRMDAETGKLTLVNEKESLCPEPSYICMDKSQQFLLVSLHADPWHVTKIEKNPDGTYTNKVLFDDAGIALFRIEEDGGIGGMCDISVTQSTDGRDPDSEVNVDPVSGHIQVVRGLSRVHCVIPNPEGEIYVACDKGMDRIYTYGLDRLRGKLEQLDCLESDFKTFPRYAAFHPALQVLYVNHEFAPTLETVAYNKKTGKMHRLSQISLLFEDAGLIDGKPVGAQDIMVSPDGRTLYCSLMSVNSIAVMELDESGLPTLVQVASCGGIMPRALQISPDGRYLFSGNMISGDITVFRIGKDGRLEETGKKIDAVAPSAIRFVRL